MITITEETEIIHLTITDECQTTNLEIIEGGEEIHLTIIEQNGTNAMYRDWETDRKSTRLNSSHSAKSRMPSSA